MPHICGLGDTTNRVALTAILQTLGSPRHVPYAFGLFVLGIM